MCAKSNIPAAITFIFTIEKAKMFKDMLNEKVSIASILIAITSIS